ncbi:MAG: hypothetical protein R2844_01760 [Caldilineales bacterium]
MNGQSATVTLEVFDIKLTIKPGFWGTLAALWAVMTYMAGRGHSERSILARLCIGCVAVIVMIPADLAHAFAHTISARRAGAPMDEIVLGMHMPHTLYYDNDVPPAVHRERALGGPIYSAAALATDLATRQFTPRDSVLRELLGWSAAANAMILVGSLMPLPFVDGGSILKWTLVERGMSEEAAEDTVLKVNLGLGAAAGAAGAGLVAARKRTVGLGLIGAAGFLVAVGLGKIRQI